MTAEVIYLADYLRKQLGMPKTAPKAAPSQDVEFINHGSIWLCRPITPAGHAWISNNIPEDAPWWGVALAIEARCVPDIVQGMTKDGLELVNGDAG